MTFDPNAQLDPSSVTDARGGSRMGGGGGLAVGGGGLGIVIAIVYLLLGGDPSVLMGSGSGGATVDVNGPDSSALATATYENQFGGTPAERCCSGCAVMPATALPFTVAIV